ncbi:YDG/SRA domain-containing protein [Streptomyces sp. NPDC006207]
MIGEVPNVEVGQPFESRRLAHEAGVHRPLQAGICGTKKTGAESIVVSGGYKDDEDYGNVINLHRSRWPGLVQEPGQRPDA